MTQQVEGYPPRPPETSSKAIVALVFGILGITSGCTPLGIVGIVVGNQAQDEIATARGRLTGDGLAKAGTITGWVGVALLVVQVLFMCLFFGLFGLGAAGSAVGG